MNGPQQSGKDRREEFIHIRGRGKKFNIGTFEIKSYKKYIRTKFVKKKKKLLKKIYTFKGIII